MTEGAIRESLDLNRKALKTAIIEITLIAVGAIKVTLLWIKTAKRDESRVTRINETVRLAAKGIKGAHPEARGQ